MARFVNNLFLLFTVVAGAYFLLLGTYLAYLGGSLYYALSGVVMLRLAWIYFRQSYWSVKFYGGWLLFTLIWSIYESDGYFLALLPRLAMWSVLALWFSMPWVNTSVPTSGNSATVLKRVWLAGPVALGVVVALITLLDLDNDPIERISRPEVASEAITDWRSYGNTDGGTRFAELEQINLNNVAGLEEAWRFRTKVDDQFKGTPLHVDGVLYFCAATNIVFALDDSSGEELWRYDPKAEIPGEHQYAKTCRGVAYAETNSDSGETCSTRIFTGTVDARLIALDAKTGRECESFGESGAVDLRRGMSAHIPSQYYISSPPQVANDVVVVGGLVMDSQRLGLPSGVVRAYSVTSGELKWVWDIGRIDDADLAEQNVGYTPGTPNVWSMMSFDKELGLIYLPTGNASPDYYGGERREFDDKYASSVVALDVVTGKPRWSFQTVHHDVWDYDVPAQPTLVDIRKEGEMIPSVVVATKRGELFVLDRRTGEPVHPIEERPVPQNGVEGERLSPTQPFSSLPNFRPHLYEKDMWGLTPFDQLLCRVEYKMMRYEGHFTPPTTQGTLQFPGNFGGYNWGGISVDADRGLLVASPMMLAMRTIMVTPEQVHDAGSRAAKLLGDYHPAVNFGDDRKIADARKGYTPHDEHGEYDYRKIKYYGLTMPFMSRFKLPFIGGTEVPCFEPPWSKIAVIDLNNNELLWSKPLGSMNESGPFGIRSGLHFDVGVAIRAGTLTTRGGLTFVSSTMDQTVRAYDVDNGDVLWKHSLPGNGQSTPMSYVSKKDGKQYIIVTVPNPSWRYPRDPETGTYTDSKSVVDGRGGYVIAYAIPD